MKRWIRATYRSFFLPSNLALIGLLLSPTVSSGRKIGFTSRADMGSGANHPSLEVKKYKNNYKDKVKPKKDAI